MFVPFQYYDPKTWQEFVAITQVHKDYQILAGGTDLLVKMRGGYAPYQHVVDIKKITDLPEMKGIRLEQDGIFLGALTTFTEILDCKSIQENFTALYEASQVMGCYEIRNRATIGGNICNAASGAEGGSSLLIFDAIVHIVTRDGKKSMPLQEFYHLYPGKDGAKKPGIRLGPGELVTHFFLPYLPLGRRSVYVRRARTLGMDLASLNLSMALFRNPYAYEVRIAAGAVGALPCRFPEIEVMLGKPDFSTEMIESTKKRLSEIIEPRPNSKRAGVDYKKDQIGELFLSALQKCGIEKE